MVDFRLTTRQDTKAVKAFVNKATDRIRLHRTVTIVTGKAETYRRVIRKSNLRDDPSFDSIRHIYRQRRNNLIDGDHAALKRLLGYRQSFRALQSSKTTISGIEKIRAIKHGHIHHKQPSVMRKPEFVGHLFEIAA